MVKNNWKTIILSGNPISTQTIYKSTTINGYNRTYMTRQGRDRKDQYKWEAKSQWGRPILEGDVEVCIRLFFKDKRRRDYDNYGKLLNDSLEGVVFIDDKQIQRAVIEKHLDKENPRIEVSVRGIDY